ncbi:stage II sporulation protein M [Clostridium carnis]
MNIINKLSSNFKENKIFYFLVLSFFFVGILLGTYTINYMGTADATDLSNYFTSFAKTLGSKEINSTALILDILKKNILMIGLILTLGFTVFGAPFILIMDLIKGFTLGYTFAFLLTTFSGKGLWLALSSTIPQNLFYIPVFIGISIIALEISSIKLKERFFNGNSNNRIVLRDLLVKIGFFIVVFSMGVMIEAYLCPGLIKLIITKVYKIA